MHDNILIVLTDFSIDANEERPEFGLGRLVNHGIPGNCMPVLSKYTPRLYLMATKDIQPNEQLLYDYNERDPDVLADDQNGYLRRQ